jgi:hypothetical protein
MPYLPFGQDLTTEIGWERVFPLWGFARGVRAVSASLDTYPLMLCYIADIHPIVLNITGLAVSFAVGDDPSFSFLILA